MDDFKKSYPLYRGTGKLAPFVLEIPYAKKKERRKARKKLKQQINEEL